MYQNVKHVVYLQDEAPLTCCFNEDKAYAHFIKTYGRVFEAELVNVAPKAFYFKPTDREDPYSPERFIIIPIKWVVAIFPIEDTDYISIKTTVKTHKRCADCKNYDKCDPNCDRVNERMYDLRDGKKDCYVSK